MGDLRGCGICPAAAALAFIIDDFGWALAGQGAVAACCVGMGGGAFIGPRGGGGAAVLDAG